MNIQKINLRSIIIQSILFKIVVFSFFFHGSSTSYLLIFLLVLGNILKLKYRIFSRLIFLLLPSINIFNKGLFFLNHDFLELQVVILNIFIIKDDDFYFYIRRLILIVWFYSGLKKLISYDFLKGDVIRWLFLNHWQTEISQPLSQFLSFFIIILEIALPLIILRNINHKKVRFTLLISQFVIFIFSYEYSFFISIMIMMSVFLKKECLQVTTTIKIHSIFKLYIIWPIIHSTLCTLLLISPWRLGGYGMYSTIPYHIKNEIIIGIQGIKYNLDLIPFRNRKKSIVLKGIF